MVDYSKFDHIDSSSDSDAPLPKRTLSPPRNCHQTFRYPCGSSRARIETFDIRAEACKPFGFVHGDVVRTDRGAISTAIGVREGSLWFHVDGAHGAGVWPQGTSLKLVGQVTVQAGGAPKAPSFSPEFLVPDFSYPAGVLEVTIGKFDIRDDVCMKVGGFCHGQVVNVPSMKSSAVTIGVRRDEADRVHLWFHMDGSPGAGIFDEEDLPKMKVTGRREVKPISTVPEKDVGALRRLRKLLGEDSDSDSLDTALGSGHATFSYVLRSKEMGLFDIRDEACRAFGFLHGDVVVTDNGIVSTAIGVRGGQLWFHMEGSPGAGIWEDEELKVVGQVKVPEGRVPEAPSLSSNWLKLTFAYPAGLHRATVEKFDTRDEVCSKLGGFKHGEVVKVPGVAKTVVTVGAKREADGRLLLWFHHEDHEGAGLLSQAALKRAKVVGHKALKEAASGATAEAPTEKPRQGCASCRQLQEALEEERRARQLAERRVDAAGKCASCESLKAALKEERRARQRVEEKLADEQKASSLKVMADREVRKLQKKNQQLRESNDRLIKSTKISQRNAEKKSHTAEKNEEWHSRAAVQRLANEIATERVSATERRISQQFEERISQQKRFAAEESRELLKQLADLTGEKERLEAATTELEEKLCRSREREAELHSPSALVVNEETWEFKDSSQNWVPYPLHVSKDIMAAYRASSSSCTVHCNGTAYQIDFSMMKQMNLQTCTRRDVRCRFDLPPHWAMTDQQALQSKRSGQQDHTSAPSEVSSVSRVTGISQVAVTVAPFKKHVRKITAPSVLKKFEQLLEGARLRHDGSRCPGCPHSNSVFKVHEVYQVENLYLWRRYQRFCQSMHDKQVQFGISPEPVRPPVGDALTKFGKELHINEAFNERLLLHGTRRFAHAKVIAVEGFDNRIAQEGLYGQGTYFASQSCKSAQYGGYRPYMGRQELGTIIVSRVALGDPYYTPGQLQEKRPPSKRVCDNPDDSDDERMIPPDSVIAAPGICRHGGTQLHMEFVTFSPEQAYPEYLVRYSEGGTEWGP